MRNAKSKRDSKFELWRIIAMCFIILSHYSLFGNSPVTNIHTTFYEPFGEIGADIFVMLSGYFLCTQSFNIKKNIFRVTRIWLRTIYYSWIIFILFSIFYRSILNSKNIITSIFPIAFNEYWFITSFIFLMMIVPILNDVINKVSQHNLKIIILIMLFISGVQPLISAFSPFGAILNVGIMITSYVFSSYIRKYGLRFSNLFFICILIISFLFQYILCHFFNTNIFTYGILPFICAGSIFILVVRSKSFYNAVVNWFAASVFACYLITSHPLINSVLWSKWVDTAKLHYPVLFGPIIVLCILIITVLIDQIYLFLERKKFNFIISYFVNKVVNYLKFKNK